MTDWTGDGVLDRLVDQRIDPAWVRAAWAEPETVLLRVGDAQVAAGSSGLECVPVAVEYDPELHYLLGRIDGRAWFTAAADAGLVSLRSVMDSLPEHELQAAFTAVGLVGWHTRARFCPACGGPTQAVAGGFARSCPDCAQELYPRTDPAVIVAILDADDRLLLGRQAGWAPGRYSVFAGFAEMGESLEQAVRREIAEEVGLPLGDLGYLGSQPWPFPRSLMVAFVAHAAATELRVNQIEIEGARWFTRDQLRTALSGELSLPYRTSIARRMIDDWLNGTLNRSPFPA